jgi:hypothetical protein
VLLGSEATFKERLFGISREETNKIRMETRQTLNEHFEYLKEIHGQVEERLKKNRED